MTIARPKPSTRMMRVDGLRLCAAIPVYQFRPASYRMGKTMDTLNPRTCHIAYLKRLAECHHVAYYIDTTGRFVIRPYRGPRPDIHAACVARHDELLSYLIATRVPLHDPDKAADDASMRVCGIPYEALCNLAIYHLNIWLARADNGLLVYEPPLPPRWDDGLVHDDHDPKPKRRTRQRKQSALPDRVVFG